MTSQYHVEQEMSYTTWEESCKEPSLMQDADTGKRDDLRECRRRANHADKHASGFGAGYRTW
jgi:hypothetical protein